MFVRFFGSLSPFAFALVLAPACSTTFVPRTCTDDSECGGDGLVCVAAGATSSCAAAASSPLRIGMAAPISGPSQDLGVEMKRGVELALKAQNDAGGVRGRPIELVFRDDEYRPDLAEAAANALCDAQPQADVAPKCPTTLKPPANGAAVAQTALTRGPDAVLAVLGNVGTPTMVRFAPIAVETGTMFFGAFTGASTMLRDDLSGDCHRFIFNVRASYADEAEATLEFFRKRGVQTSKHLISFDQNDSFGQAGFDGLTKAYAKQVEPLTDANAIPRYRYTKDDQPSIAAAITGVEANLAALLVGSEGKQTVGIFMTDTYGPAAQFIKEVRTWQYADPERTNRLELYFSNVSFVGPNSLSKRLVEGGALSSSTGMHPLTDNVFVSQVVPNYESDPSEVVRDYLAALATTGAAPTFTSLEGYVAGRVFTAGLVAHTGPFTPDALVPTFEQLPQLSLGLGASSGFKNGNHDYSRTVWGTSIGADGKFGNVYYWSEGVPISFFQ